MFRRCLVEFSCFVWEMVGICLVVLNVFGMPLEDCRTKFTICWEIFGRVMENIRKIVDMCFVD